MENIKYKVPRVASIHDISCFGRCAQTVIIPTLSVLGVQTVPIPTALLSTHTGGFDGFSFHDLTDQMQKISDHFDDMRIVFDGVYSGFLANEYQAEFVLDFAKKCKSNNPSCKFLADPVMGDDGEMYKTYTKKMCDMTREIVKDADIITPNLTEAYILSDMPYNDSPDEKEQRKLIEELKKITNADIVITGIVNKINDKTVISSVYSDKIVEFARYDCPYVDRNYPGTGDVFASVVLAGEICGESFDKSIAKASEFIRCASEYTKMCDTPVREGLCLEGVLHKLCK